MKITKLVVLIAFVLFGLTFSSCKNCNGDKGKDNGENNPVTDRDKDNSAIDGDKDKDNPDNPADGDKNNPDNVSVLDNPNSDEARMTAERKVARLAELEKKAQLIENDVTKLIRGAQDAMVILSRALNDENLFYDAIAAVEAIDGIYSASFKAFNSILDIQKEMHRGIITAEINNKAYETAQNVAAMALHATNMMHDTKMRAHETMNRIRNKWPRP